MSSNIKRYFPIVCISFGVFLIIGAGILIVISHYAENKTLRERSEVISRIYAVMPKDSENSGYNSMLTAPSIDIDGTDYIGILNIPSLEAEFPIAVGDVNLRTSVYRISEYDAPLVLSGDNKLWSLTAGMMVGEDILIKDMRGYVYKYKVSRVDIAASYDLSQILNTVSELTLITVLNNQYVVISCEN